MFYLVKFHQFVFLLMLFQSADSVEFKRLCQNRMLDIGCEKDGEVLVIKSSLFGRTQKSTRECGYQSTAMCVGRDTALIVAGTCAIRPTCSLYASTGVFGNPCKAIYKYLDINYECINRNRIVSICDQEKLTVEAGESGFIYTPNYPAAYDKDATCRLNIEAPHGTDVIVTLLHANFPDENTCARDSLTIADGTRTRVQTCSDESFPTNYDFENVSITFKSGAFGTFLADHPAIAKGAILEFKINGCAIADLSLPAHGMLTKVQSGLTATVGCESGFQPSHGTPGDCVCQRHKWLCEPVHCQPIPCEIGAVVTPDNMRRSVVDEGRTVLLRCKTGFRPLNGPLAALRCVNGNWTGDTGACVALECDPKDAEIPSLMKGFVSDDQRRITFRCKGRKIPANGTLGELSCVHGAWTGQIGDCRDTMPISALAFTAQRTNRSEAIEAGILIPFDVTLTNLGRAFHPSEHLFEAPTNGTYFFTWTVTGVTTDAILSLIRDNMVVTESWVSASDVGRVAPPTSGQVTLRLAETQELWLELRPTESNRFVTVPVASLPENVPVVTFSGFMISEN